MLGCTIPPAFLRVSEEGGEQSTGAWRKQLRREVVSGGSSAVKHGTWRKWLHRSGAACGKAAAGGGSTWRRQRHRTRHLRDAAPWGSRTWRQRRRGGRRFPGMALRGTAPVGSGAGGELCLRECAEGYAVWGDTPGGHTCGGTHLWGTHLGEWRCGEWHLWRTLARQDGACEQLCRGQWGAGFPGMVPGGAMVQENGSRNSGVGKGADCQELWGRKGGQCCWERMPWEASTVRDIPEGSAEP